MVFTSAVGACPWLMSTVATSREVSLDSRASRSIAIELVVFDGYAVGSVWKDTACTAFVRREGDRLLGLALRIGSRSGVACARAVLSESASSASAASTTSSNLSNREIELS